MVVSMVKDEICSFNEMKPGGKTKKKHISVAGSDKKPSSLVA